jgi:hypothetical protein
MAVVGLVLVGIGDLSWLGVMVQTKFWGKEKNNKFLPEWIWSS